MRSIAKIVRRIIQWSIFLIFISGFLPAAEFWDDKVSSIIPKIQFFPVIQRLSIVGIIIIAVTLLFGRIYCSSICPLATIQDIFTGRKQKFSFRRLGILKRYLIPAAALIALLSGWPALASLVDPYSLSGRIVSTVNELIIMPLIDLAGLILRYFSIYITIYPIQFRWITIGISLLSLAVIVIMSRIGGRLFCNTLCPVGAILSIPARWALFTNRIHAGKCTSCGACEKVCKAEAIDSASKIIDTSKCVSCFNCNEVCNFDALKYRTAIMPKTGGTDRRDFIKKSALGSLLLIGAPVLAKSVNLSKVVETDSSAAVPPGAGSRADFLSKCTACSLCISRCPGNVLQPASFKQYGLTSPGVPYMDFNRGSCDFKCNLCSNLCPSGAIKPIDLAKKQRVKIGESRFVRQFCVVETDNTSCGACGEICPSGAIDMVHLREGANGALEIPVIDKTYCIGCGACQFVCPVIKKNAIFVEPFAQHGKAEVWEDRPEEEKEEVNNDFAF
jgi:ferredoxin